MPPEPLKVKEIEINVWNNALCGHWKAAAVFHSDLCSQTGAFWFHVRMPRFCSNIDVVALRFVCLSSAAWVYLVWYQYIWLNQRFYSKSVRKWRFYDICATKSCKSGDRSLTWPSFLLCVHERNRLKLLPMKKAEEKLNNQNLEHHALKK